MNQKNRILILGVLAISAILLFMTWDFYTDTKNEKNPYEYDISSFKEVDSALISHREIQQIPVDIEVLRAIAVDEQDRIYVSGKDKILIFSKKGQLLQELKFPMEAFALATDLGNLFVGSRAYILRFDLDGNRIDSIPLPFEKPILTSIAIKGQELYVADAGNKIVHRLNLKGELLNELGAADSTQGIDGFVIPSPYFDVAVGNDAEIWAVNTGRHQLESYHEDGRKIYSWNRTSMNVDGFSGCCNPSHIAILKNGHFVTSEKGIERVKISDQTGNLVSVVAPPSAFEKGTKGLDIAVDSEERILVIDPVKKLIRIFVKK